MGSDLHSDVALPVTSVSQSFRLFMPTGRFNWAISPVRLRYGATEGKGRVMNEGCTEEGEKMRNEGERAVGLITYT